MKSNPIHRCYFWGAVGLLALALSPQLTAQKKNFRVGPVFFDAAARFAIEYNDNINSSAQNPEEDIILSPGISLDSEWKATDFNTLSFNIGIGYRKYLNNSDLDSGGNFLDITPDTRLAFSVFIDNLTLEFYDEFSYTVDATDAFARNAQGQVITNVAQYGRFSNNVGVRADWDFNDVKLDANASRADLFPADAEFDFTERTVHRLAGGVRFILAPNLTAGLRGSVEMSDYSDNFQNDGIRYSFGPNFAWQPTSLISLSGGVGYTLNDFDTGGGNLDNSESDSTYWNLNIGHRASRFYSHSLNVSSTTNLGFVSNTTEVYRIAYRGDWQISRTLALTGGISFETSEDSGGFSAEDFDRYIFDLATQFVLSDHLTSRLFYEFSSKDSNLSTRSFDRNRIVLSFRYDF